MKIDATSMACRTNRLDRMQVTEIMQAPSSLRQVHKLLGTQCGQTVETVPAADLDIH